MIKSRVVIKPGRIIMANIFRDPLERRPRALWRLLLQGLVFFLLLAGLQIASGIFASAFIQFPAELIQMRYKIFYSTTPCCALPSPSAS
jgi:TRAP-type C4-dicarboxylate transport system permease small subunit